MDGSCNNNRRADGDPYGAEFAIGWCWIGIRNRDALLEPNVFQGSQGERAVLFIVIPSALVVLLAGLVLITRVIAQHKVFVIFIICISIVGIYSLWFLWLRDRHLSQWFGVSPSKNTGKCSVKKFFYWSNFHNTRHSASQNGIAKRHIRYATSIKLPILCWLPP